MHFYFCFVYQALLEYLLLWSTIQVDLWDTSYDTHAQQFTAVNYALRH